MAISAKIAVISDLHYASPQIMIKDGKALQEYLSHDRKLIKESDAILKETVKQLMLQDVDIVLVPGDLTKDGEKLSHVGVAKILKPLIDKGVSICVVPGNHDINNPNARIFNGDKTENAETVTTAEFKKIYDDYGYGKAISKDKFSLSYVAQPIEGLRILCLDACKYYDNTFKNKGARRDSCVTNGYLKPETLKWIEKETKKAKEEGCQIMAMMHHNVVSHFDNQVFFAKPYLVENYKDVQKLFMNLGIKTVFTGHFHSSDITSIRDAKNNELFDIETGSIVTYPCPYRIIDFNSNELAIRTNFINQIDFPMPNGMTFTQYAQHQIEKGFDEILENLITEYHSTFNQYIPKWASLFMKVPQPQIIAKLLQKNLSKNGMKMILAHYYGNENTQEFAIETKEETLKGIDSFITEISKESSGIFWKLTRHYLAKSGAVSKAKATVNSIWEDNLLANKNAKEYISLENPTNDLYLSINLQETNYLEPIYADLIKNKVFNNDTFSTTNLYNMLAMAQNRISKIVIID